MENKFKVYGIATDTIQKKDKLLLDKNGKRQYGAVGWYRIINPLKKLGAFIDIGVTLRSSYDNAMAFKEKGDIWFSKMSDNEGIDVLYKAHKEVTGAKFVLDLDDDPDHVNKDHPDYETLKKKRDMRIRMVKMADHVVVSTRLIAESIKHLNPYITVIPNAIDPKIWKYKNKVKKDGIIRIGWVSSGSHFSDVPIIQPVMDEILAKYPNVEFHFAGMTWEEHKQDRFYHHVGCVGYKKFPKWYSEQGINIALAPLKDTQFNRCKSNIKWMEASMLEIPVVASDVEPYRCIKHGKTGFLATSTEQWVKYLSLLIENEAKRREIGMNAKQDVLENWSIDKFLPLYEELFEKLSEKPDITVVTAITGGKDHLEPQPQYKNVEYVAFIDTDEKNSQWKTRKACDKFVTPVMNAKIHKILTHKYVNTPYIVWMDGNCTLKQDPHELVKLMGDKDMAFFKHPGRDCLYDEVVTCVQMGKGKIEELLEQNKDYANPEKYGFPEHAGLNELTCFVRKNTPKVNELFEKWWSEICRYSNRDQISFPVVFQGQEWATIPGTVTEMKGMDGMIGNDFFQYKLHQVYKNDNKTL